MTKPILYYAIKHYNFQNNIADLTDEDLIKCSVRTYNQLLLRIEQMGYHEIKSDEIKAISLFFMIPEIISLDLMHLELVKLTRQLVKDLNGEVIDDKKYANNQ